ncbi:hypothetical protein BDZ91DRAFT_486583 [Kalaharituber pfeilii]|nr:hypothetical protein BDZ91DRAFT_486583 [Kalaharituber pfeilii]
MGNWRKYLVNNRNKITATIRITDQFGTELCTCSNLSTKKCDELATDISALKRSYGELLECITGLIERNERTFTAIMSSKSILESQRAISQASRLTELAFIFIPLSLAASIFGVEVPE